jgi:hypothetical protein
MSVFAPVGPPSSAQILKLAVQNLACHPQAQRRYVQLGWMDRAVANLERIGADLDPLVATEDISEEEAAIVRELRDEVQRALSRRPGLLELDRRGPREFLFSNALENDDWDRIRQIARLAHGKLSGGRSVFISIMAK